MRNDPRLHDAVDGRLRKHGSSMFRASYPRDDWCKLLDLPHRSLDDRLSGPEVDDCNFVEFWLDKTISKHLDIHGKR